MFKIGVTENNDPYSSFSISCLKARFWGIMHDDILIVLL